ncbi:MAG: hypothetical protein KDD44_10275 [Bdellovibrionales bacterium]|nr:hypothetical protein [Bdellovibrionales bacterium]
MSAEESCQALCQEVRLLTEAARGLLDDSPAGDPEAFQTRVATYIQGFDQAQLRIQEHVQAVTTVDSALKVALQELHEAHVALAERVATFRDTVGVELRNLHQRQRALRRYVDPFPQRITIAGRRKG